MSYPKETKRRQKVMFDVMKWMKLTEQVTLGDTTFEEAFQRTGKILNITVTSRMKFGEPIALNYLTTPRVLIKSAVIASSAIPGILKPIKLLAKDENGNIEEFEDFGECWADGGIKLNLPMKELSQLFNVTYFVVSQVSPSTVPLLMQAKGSPGCPRKGYRGGFLLHALEVILQQEFTKWFSVLDELELAPAGEVDMRKLFLQETMGDVTIVPQRGWKLIFDLSRLLKDPDYQWMKHYIENGMRFTFPKICMIEHHYRLEQILNHCENDLLQKIKKTK
jgi:predicted acylesterase/phospholipase RssA